MTMGVVLLLAGCDDFVEVGLPSSQLTSEAVFESTATANAAMANIYAGFRENGLLTGKPSGLSNLMGGYADELTYYGSAGGYAEDFYNNSLLATNNTVDTFWSVTYNQIYAANAVIEGVQASSALPDADKARLEGEGLFARALLHLYLVNLFGDVPYVATTDYRVNSTVSRMPTVQVYERVIADLEQALPLLPETYSSVRRVKPNKWVAQAILARAYLYAGRWEEASNAASAVLNHTELFSLNLNINSVFLRSSAETIWQLQPEFAGENTEEGFAFIFNEGPPPSMALNEGLIAAFEPGDLRLDSWTRAITDGSQTWYHAYKYKQQGATSTTQENSIMIRVAEMYLIRAEARARQGELIGAKEDLDAIRARAGLAAATALTQDEVVQAVLRERRVELFTELGHRFFDLKRFGAADAVLDPVKPSWETTDALLPIPETELLRNPNLGAQNPGY